MASLSLQHINKTYPNGFQAVKDFNLEIEDKEFIIFVGPQDVVIYYTSYDCRSGRNFRRYIKDW